MQDEDRATRRQAATDARSDALLARQQSLDLGMAQLNSASAKSNREFDYQNRVLDYNMKARKAEANAKDCYGFRWSRFLICCLITYSLYKYLCYKQSSHQSLRVQSGGILLLSY